MTTSEAHAMTDPQQAAGTALRVRVGCDFTYTSVYPTPMMLIVKPKDWAHHHVLDEYRLIEPGIPVRDYVDSFGNHVWRLTAPVGELHIRYDAVVEVPATGDPVYPDLPRTEVENLPNDVLMYTLPSRYCQSDLFIGEAWEKFGNVPGGWQQVQAVCDWIHGNIEYAKGSTSTTSSYDVYQAGRGVCRDFAHMGVTLCRALNYPARYVCGYLPDINVPIDPVPMDFHAWFEVFVGGGWHSFDARHNRHRTGRTLIASGRDAVDVAFATSYGSAQLTGMQVWADQVSEDYVLERVPEPA
jgi:transglutaminase-like putative cysteine protease